MVSVDVLVLCVPSLGPRFWACLNYFSLLLYLTHVCVGRLMVALPAEHITKRVPMWLLSLAYVFGLMGICYGIAFGCCGKLLGVFGVGGRRSGEGAQYSAQNTERQKWVEEEEMKYSGRQKRVEEEAEMKYSGRGKN